MLNLFFFVGLSVVSLRGERQPAGPRVKDCVEGDAFQRHRDPVPQEAVSGLPQRAKIEGVEGGERDQGAARFPRGEADGVLRSLGAHIHRDALGAPVRRAAQLGREK